MHAVGRVRGDARILADACKYLVESDVRVRIFEGEGADLFERGIEIAAET